MPILAQVMERRAAGATLAQMDSFLDWLTAGNTAAGAVVNETEAMKFVTIFACVKVIAESVAMLPLHVYKRRPEKDKGKDRARDHPLYELLHSRPNPEMTKMSFFECALGHLLTWGNFYAEKEIKRTGRVKGLWPLRPDKMTVMRDASGEIRYYYRQTTSKGVEIEKTFARDQIWHPIGFSNNGLVGYSPIRQMRETVALGMALQEYGARFFGNDSRPGGILKHPSQLNDDAYKRMKKSWESAHRGLSQKHRIAILEEGVEWQQVGLDNEDSQFVQSRKFQIEEVCRIYRIQPHKVAHLERATFSNIEHQSIEFVTDTLMPWLVRVEQSLSWDVMTQADRTAGYFVEHLVHGLLRGDSKQRADYYNKMFQMGSLSPNDIRELENENPIDGGDKYYVQMNLMPLSGDEEEPGEEPEKPPEPSATPYISTRKASEKNAWMHKREAEIIRKRKTLAKRYKRLLLDGAQRTVNRETIAVKRQAKKLLGERSAEEFDRWLDEFYGDMPAHVIRNLGGAAATYMESIFALTAAEIGISDEIGEELTRFIDGYVEVLAERHVDRSVGQIRAIVAETETGKLVDALTARMDEWADKRPGKIAGDESIREMNAAVHEQYRRGGVTRIRWVNTGSKSCPYCVSLDGMIVGIEDNFLDQDQDFQPEGAEQPLHVRRSTMHPPAHGGCQCEIFPE